MAKKQGSEEEKNVEVPSWQEETSSGEVIIVSAEATAWVQKMYQIPCANVRGAGSTHENRCIPEAIKVVCRRRGRGISLWDSWINGS